MVLFFSFNLGYMCYSQSYEKQFIWNKRVIILLADSPDNENFISQMNIFGSQENEMAERDLILISNHSQKIPIPERNLLYENYVLPGSNFTIVLLGKDGGVKLKRIEPVPADELYALIDSMPMRKRELKDQQK